MSFLPAATVPELETAGLVHRLVGGRRVLLVRADGDVRAYEDRCAHLGLPLGGGRLEGTTLFCPHHEWEYDVRSGRGVNPATVCLKSFPVAVDRDQILVDVG